MTGPTALLLFAMTVLGALLPFAVVAALLGAPVYVFLRRRRHPRSGQAAADSA